MENNAAAQATSEQEMESAINSLDDVLKEHEEGAPAENLVHEAKILNEDDPRFEPPADTDPKNTFKDWFLGQGFVDGLITSAILWLLTNGNAWLFNMVFTDKFRIKASQIDLDENDKKIVHEAIHQMMPKIMAFLKKMPSYVLAFGYLEYCIWKDMWENKTKLAPQRDEEEEKPKKKKESGETERKKDTKPEAPKPDVKPEVKQQDNKQTTDAVPNSEAAPPSQPQSKS